HCPLGAPARGDSPRPGDGGRRRAVLHPAAGSQAAHMTGIAANNLSVRRNGATLLDGLSLSLGPTGSCAIVGPKGAGKWTLLKVLPGIDKPSAGSVQVGDRDLASLSNSQRADTIGYMPQYFEPHWDLSVAELVRLGAERSDRLA